MIKEKYISLKLANKIKEIVKERGIKLPESEYAYYYNPYHAGVGTKILLLKYKKDGILMKSFSCFAYDTYELGEILPETITLDCHIQGIKTEKVVYRLLTGNDFCTYSKDMVITKSRWYKEDKTEVMARGKMLLYLLKNNLLK